MFTVCLPVCCCCPLSAGRDYQAVSEVLTFPASSYPTTLCVGIPLLPDTLREDQETVALSWRLEGAGSLGEVTTPTASITIVDVRGKAN